MENLDIQEIITMRKHLRIIHHVPGRIRFRLGAALYRYAASFKSAGLGALLDKIDGVDDLRLNPAAASLVIQYDPKQLAPDLWETLIDGSDSAAEQLIQELIALYEPQLSGVTL